MACNPMIQMLGNKSSIDPAVVAQAKQIMQMPDRMNAVMQFIGGRNIEPLVRQMAQAKGVDLNEIFALMK